MFAKSYASRAIGKRLDANFYDPVLLDNDEQLHSITCDTVENIRIPDAPIVYGILKPTGNSDTYRVIKAENFEGMFVDPTNCEEVNKELYFEFERSVSQPGDILIAIGGYVGRPAILQKSSKLACNINRHLARFRVNPAFADPYFVCAFLSCRQGQLSLNRQITGSLQAGINLEDLREIKIPRFSMTAQRYIGDKVRQAERLRAWAAELESKADSRISLRFDFSPAPSFHEEPRKVKPKFVTGTSLSPNFTEALQTQSTFVDSIPISEVSTSIKCGDPIREDDRVAGGFPYYGASGPIDTHNEFNFDGTNLIVAQDGSIGMVSVSTGKIWANNHVWVVQIASDFDIDTVARYLKNHYPCWRGMTTGSVVPKITSENLLKVLVPRSVASDVTAGDFLRTKELCFKSSQRLVQAATSLIEALIDGGITERELEIAQAELEAGNRDSDAALLSRLTKNGLDAGGDLLFPEVSDLYDLLDRCNKDEEDV